MDPLRKLAICMAVALLPMAANADMITFDFEEFSNVEIIGGPNGALVSNGFVFAPGAVDWYPDWSPEDWSLDGVEIGHYHIADPTEAWWGANNGSNYFVFDYFFDQSILNL